MHRRSRRRSLSLTELRDAAWVLPGPDNALRRHLESMFMAANVPWPVNCVTTTSLPMIESLLKGTQRIALITGMLQQAWHVRSIALPGAGVRTIGIKRRRAGQLSPVAAQLRQIALELLQETASQSKHIVVKRRRRLGYS